MRCKSCDRKRESLLGLSPFWDLQFGVGLLELLHLVMGSNVVELLPSGVHDRGRGQNGYRDGSRSDVDLDRVADGEVVDVLVHELGVVLH